MRLLKLSEFENSRLLPVCGRAHLPAGTIVDAQALANRKFSKMRGLAAAGSEAILNQRSGLGTVS